MRWLWTEFDEHGERFKSSRLVVGAVRSRPTSDDNTAKALTVRCAGFVGKATSAYSNLGGSSMKRTKASKRFVHNLVRSGVDGSVCLS